MDHAPPFQNGGESVDPLIFTILGALVVLFLVSSAYIWWLHRRREIILPEELQAEDEEEEEPRIDQIGLSKRAEDILETVLETPMLQNELPKELGVSKATVSNAVSELFDRNLVKKKKKANTYLIEPNREEIQRQ